MTCLLFHLLSEPGYILGELAQHKVRTVGPQDRRRKRLGDTIELIDVTEDKLAEFERSKRVL
jgi:hypothetical protein